MAEASGKSFIPESFPGYSSDVAGQIGVLWELIKAPLIVPLLTICVYICLAMSIMVFLERLYMGVVIVLVKLFWKKPEKRYKWEAMKDDLEMGNAAFPMVLVQIPMFNEKEVYKISIGAACNLSWPSDRLVIQVLDDSTDFVVKDMVEKECIRWASKGVNIRYQIRESRGGYKAGALKEGLKHDYVKECDYVVIFDADFRPEPDFLRRAVPFLIHNPKIALVQARWRFGNFTSPFINACRVFFFFFFFEKLTNTRANGNRTETSHIGMSLHMGIYHWGVPERTACRGCYYDCNKDFDSLHKWHLHFQETDNCPICGICSELLKKQI